MAKRLATDAVFQVCNEALQLHRGYGYLKDFLIERATCATGAFTRSSKIPTKSCASSSHDGC
jgi:alkylation response protein AidB-like acyl-CoA dehydrogenase